MTTPRHKYQYKAKSYTAAAKALRMVGVGKRVLELGSGPGSVTRLLKENQCRVTALEIDLQAIEIVSQYCEKVYSCDLNDPAWPDILSESDKFETIVATDVLEHLYDPWITLKKLQPLLAGDGCVVISLPHAGHNAVIACLLNGDFEYQPRGLLDKTHIRFFALKNIQRLFNDAGYKIIEADFVVKTPTQTEFAQNWRHLPSKTRQALAGNKFGMIYQVVVKAVPDSAPGKGLRLETIPVASSDPGSFSTGSRGSRTLGFILSFMSLNTRDRISNILQRFGLRL
jgi:2-polyprenyl-3-methyl-5-hydroxy-6-metoxy-1,4-benzoquinol methylase